jgi:hypothetical protein
MMDSLVDILKKLREGAYQNEEHVRLSLVARILQDLGWDIWNPRQVNAEFAPTRAEDNTRVDFALFSTSQTPSVLIEVKAVGKIANLEQAERQLRDYNKNFSAPFCLITDGRVWRFYYPQTAGEFSEKCFKVLDLLADDLNDTESALKAFLSKSAIANGDAEKEAKILLKLTRTQRAMEECLPRARRLTQEPPYPSLPDALITLVAEVGFQINRQDAEDFISKPRREMPPQPPPPTKGEDKDVIQPNPERPGSLRFTAVDEGRIGEFHANAWNGLVVAGIKIALERGHTVADLNEWLSANVEEGIVTDRGFQPIPRTSVSLQSMQTEKAWENAFALAKKLALPIQVRFHWRQTDGAAHPGKQGILRWSPE